MLVSSAITSSPSETRFRSSDALGNYSITVGGFETIDDP
jgi:hypothetical protein